FRDVDFGQLPGQAAFDLRERLSSRSVSDKRQVSFAIQSRVGGQVLSDPSRSRSKSTFELGYGFTRSGDLFRTFLLLDIVLDFRRLHRRWTRNHGMTDADVERRLPFPIRLLAPQRNEMAKRRRSSLPRSRTTFPWTCRVTQIARRRNVCEFG